MRQQLRPFLRNAPARLIYLVDRGPQAPHEWIVDTVLGAGYRLDGQEVYGGAILMLFRRES